MADPHPVPIQPVKEPILCSPYEEPDRHWLYDTKTGLPTEMASRREAGYWFRSERTGTAQLEMFAEEERDDLPLVNALRDDVRRWREAGWRNASVTTKKLLKHWQRQDRPRRLFFCQLEAVETVIYLQEILAANRRLPWRMKLARSEFEKLRQGLNPHPEDWIAKVAQHPKLVDAPLEVDGAPLVRYACKMATGAGKTVVMAMLVAWAFCNRGTKPNDPRYPRRVLVVCPNLTIKERLRVLRPDDNDNYYEKFDLVPSNLRPELAKGKVLVTNWHILSPESPEIRVGGARVGYLGDETPEAFARSRLGDLWDDEPLLVLNDEGHHAYRPAERRGNDKLTVVEKTDREQATVWVDGLDKINAACGIELCVDLSATPFYVQGSGYPEGSPFPWIVSDFSLVDAIESGITKIPRLPAMDNTGRPDPKYFRLWDQITNALRAGDRLPGGKPKPEAAFRVAQDALLVLAGQWRGKLEQMRNASPGQEKKPPVMIVVCDNTDLADHFHQMISGETWVDAEEEGVQPRSKKKRVKRYGDGLSGFEDLWNREGAEVSLRIDSKLLATAESEDPTASGTRKAAAEDLRRVVATVGKPGEPGGKIRCVVSVNMLNEGWDADNVTHILGLRAFRSQLLCEQVVGRGLRRMNYVTDPKTGRFTEEYVDVFGVPFSLIPFKGRDPRTPQPPLEDRPKHEVMALQDRCGMEIRFPVVEGYITALKRDRVVCDVDRLEKTSLDPWTTPSAVFVQPQVGYKVGHQADFGGFEVEELDRQAYYDAVHLQTIEFSIAGAIVRELTEAAHPAKGKLRTRSRQALFPQVLRFVKSYVRRRVELNGMDARDIGLKVYAQRIVDLLVTAIEPDDASGEPPQLPRLNRYRRIGSTADVHFVTVKPIQATSASHLNFVACDTGTWEQAAMFQLEQLAKDGSIVCYARNDHLELNIPYDFQGNPHAYEPDYIVRLANGVNVIVEIKGQVHAETTVKHEAAKRWVRAVNHWAELGRWDFLVCWNPQRLGDEIRTLAREWRERSAETARRIHAEAREEEARLRALGWDTNDFAQALVDLLEEPQGPQ